MLTIFTECYLIESEVIMELKQYFQAIRSINDHIMDKQAERDELIEQAQKEHGLRYDTFKAKYNEFCTT